jgi:DNA-binding NarL/FixJ family response regulator
MINIHIADDHRLVIEGYRSLLENNGFRVNGYSLNGTDVINWIDSNLSKADVLLLDISMPIKNGIEVLEYFKEKKINQKTLIISQYDDEEFIRKTIGLKAGGYLLKEEAAEFLIEAIYQVYNCDGIFLSAKVREKIVHRFLNLDKKDIPLSEIFSVQELRVLNFLRDNKNDNDIAVEMEISPSTIRSYISRMIKKVGVTNRTGLIQYGLKRIRD